MRVGRTVVDAIKTRGGDNTSYTLGQASDIMCMYRLMALHFGLVCQTCRNVFLIKFWVWHSLNRLKEKSCRSSKFSKTPNFVFLINLRQTAPHEIVFDHSRFIIHAILSQNHIFERNEKINCFSSFNVNGHTLGLHPWA